jgi:hypothetical protein
MTEYEIHAAFALSTSDHAVACRVIKQAGFKPGQVITLAQADEARIQMTFINGPEIFNLVQFSMPV